MGMAFIGVLAVVFGGSSSDGHGDPLGFIFTALAVAIYLALLYLYFDLAAKGFAWLFEQAGAGAWGLLALILPVLLPMLAVSICKTIHERRSQR